MPYNYPVMYNRGGRWFLDIDLQIDLPLATSVFQLMHKWENVWERDAEKLIERLNGIIQGQSFDLTNASKDQFQFIPAIVWAGWDVKLVTFFGSTGHYCRYNKAIYFFWDGGHVATLTIKGISWNLNANVPNGYKKQVEEVFNTVISSLDQ
jgi:hypothetical protein